MVTETMERLGIETVFVDGHRVTDAATAEVVEMVLSGRVNKRVVSLLNRAGGRAVGLSGTDGPTLRIGRHRPDGRDIGFVGRVETVDTGLLQVLLESGYLPVLSSTAADEGGQPHNVNADVVAGSVAEAMAADGLVFLSDVPGVVVDGAPLPAVTPGEARGLLASGAVSGGMRPKLEAAVAAVSGGVGRVHLIDGRTPHALLCHGLAPGEGGTALVRDEDGVG
jgi:acetylglutamate kinase